MTVPPPVYGPAFGSQPVTRRPSFFEQALAPRSAESTTTTPTIRMGRTYPERPARARMPRAWLLLRPHQGATDLGQRLLLQLPAALAREVVLLADLLERELAVVVEAEALAQDVRLDRLEVVEQAAQLLGLGLERHALGRRRLVVGRVVQELDELPAVLVRHRLVERHRPVDEVRPHLLD